MPPVKSDHRKLEETISVFLSDYEPSLCSLSMALNEAGISHYSSGCGTKSITFDIFPASTYVDEMRRMLSLARAYKATALNGFRDASAKSNYDPSQDFILYLKRWSHFAEQAMKHEGASDRGVAAARAKLIMEDLIARLGEGKTNGQYKTTAFSQLLRAIGLMLESRVETDEERHKATARQVTQHNYFKALAAARGSEMQDVPDTQVA